MVVGPRGEFVPQEFVLAAGSSLYRLFSNGPDRGANQFNPGFGPRTRFAFFGNPKVPVLYAADTEEGAVCETLLHDIPLGGGDLRPDDYADKVMARLTTVRPLQLASFMGIGLRMLGVDASEITATAASHYGEIVLWATAAHEAGFDGAVWMSHRCNTDRAYVFFGDRVSASDLVMDPTWARAFGLEPDLTWLSDFCAPLHINVGW